LLTDKGPLPTKNGPLPMNKGRFPKYKGDFIIRPATSSDQHSTFPEDICRSTSIERQPTHHHQRNGDRHGHHDPPIAPSM
jgi:hypothetical protein